MSKPDRRPDKRVEKAVALYMKGATKGEAAKAAGISAETLSRGPAKELIAERRAAAAKHVDLDIGSVLEFVADVMTQAAEEKDWRASLAAANMLLDRVPAAPVNTEATVVGSEPKALPSGEALLDLLDAHRTPAEAE